MLQKKIYYPALDGLRFFGFFLVLAYHTPKLPPLKTLTIFGEPIVALFYKNLWMSLDIFLALSAFLFAKLLLAEHQLNGKISVRDFYIRRGLRIWPLYFTFFAVMFSYDLYNVGWHWGLFRRGIGLVTFTDNFFAAVMGFNFIAYSGHLWTISYEEQFYAVIPWLLRAIFKMNLKAKLMLGTAVFLAFSGIRAACIYFDAPYPAILVLPFTHFESIFGGLVVGLLPDDTAKKIPGWLWMLLGLGIMGINTFFPNIKSSGWHLMVMYPLAGLGVSLILFSVVRDDQWFMKSFLSFKWLPYFGKITYGLYVYHILAIFIAEHLLRSMGIYPVVRPLVFAVGTFIAALGLDLLFAIASYEILEKPFLRIKTRFTAIESRPM